MLPLSTFFLLDLFSDGVVLFVFNLITILLIAFFLLRLRKMQSMDVQFDPIGIQLTLRYN